MLWRSCPFSFLRGKKHKGEKHTAQRGWRYEETDRNKTCVICGFYPLSLSPSFSMWSHRTLFVWLEGGVWAWANQDRSYMSSCKFHGEHAWTFTLRFTLLSFNVCNFTFASQYTCEFVMNWVWKLNVPCRDVPFRAQRWSSITLSQKPFEVG